jgi:hypothetical protein
VPTGGWPSRTTQHSGGHGGARGGRVSGVARATSLPSTPLARGNEPELIALLDSFRKKRNIADYERAGVVSDGEAKEMRQLAVRIRDEVVTWLRRHHPALLS